MVGCCIFVIYFCVCVCVYSYCIKSTWLVAAFFFIMCFVVVDVLCTRKCYKYTWLIVVF
jgi:hypothetical protein